MIVGIAKLLLVPGSLSFLLVIALVVLVLVGRRAWRIAAFLGSSVAAFYFCLSLPVVANRAAAVAEHGEVWTREPPRADVVVVLDGDSSKSRVDQTVRLLRASPPRWLIASGNGEWSDSVRQLAIAAGFPRDHIILEMFGRNTREQARRVRAILTSKQIDTFVLIVSTLHMPRAAATFRAFDLCPLEWPSPTDYANVNGWRALVPRWDALDLSRDAIYEVVAWLYYRRHAWLGYLATNTLNGGRCPPSAD